MRHRVRGLLLMLIIGGCMISGCMALGTTPPQPANDFDSALRACRMKQPGRLNKRVRLRPSHPWVARCLQRQGWRPDGTLMLPADTGASVRTSRLHPG